MESRDEADEDVYFEDDFNCCHLVRKIEPVCDTNEI
jgi:hypothetical protein